MLSALKGACEFYMKLAASNINKQESLIRWVYSEKFYNLRVTGSIYPVVSSSILKFLANPTKLEINFLQGMLQQKKIILQIPKKLTMSWEKTFKILEFTRIK